MSAVTQTSHSEVSECPDLSIRFRPEAGAQAPDGSRIALNSSASSHTPPQAGHSSIMIGCSGLKLRRIITTSVSLGHFSLGDVATSRRSRGTSSSSRNSPSNSCASSTILNSKRSNQIPAQLWQMSVSREPTRMIERLFPHRGHCIFLLLYRVSKEIIYPPERGGRHV